MNFVILEEKLNKLYGQPFATSDVFIQTLKHLYLQPESDKPLILSFNGGTGTGKFKK
jgi:hypothetical protein